MGRTDQGIVALWVAAHVYGKNLSYIGFCAQGKQLRDVLHVADLFDLLQIQLVAPEKYSGTVFNVGGGKSNSVSLQELTALCEEVSGQHVNFSSDAMTRPADIKWYMTDNSRVTKATGWRPRRDVKAVVRDVHEWIVSEKDLLKEIFL
jgi:CDP-paratose 2-epimerase